MIDPDAGGDANPGAGSAKQRPHEAFGAVPPRQRLVVALAFLILCLALAWLLIPFSVEVDGTTVACGSPLAPAQMGSDTPGYEACADAAGARQGIAGAVAVVSVVASFVVRAWMNRRERSGTEG